MAKKKKPAERMGYSDQDMKDTRVFRPGEDRTGYKGLSVQQMDWDDPVQVQRLRDLQAKYGIKDEGDTPKAPGLMPPPQTEI